MAQATFRCTCGVDPQVRSIRLSLVQINPPYGSVRVRGAAEAGWTALERIARPADVSTATPDVEVELLDQTRSCTLACIGWTDRAGVPHPCADIKEMTLKQGDTRFHPEPPGARLPRR
jgi:hypothetical protein